MKIAVSVPKAIKVPVYVTKTQYEVWYAKPLSLGKIDYIGNYWYTPDGMRFASSRDAMEYLCRMYDATGRLTSAAEKRAVGTPPNPVKEEVARVVRTEGKTDGTAPKKKPATWSRKKGARRDPVPTKGLPPLQSAPPAPAEASRQDPLVQEILALIRHGRGRSTDTDSHPKE